MQLNPAFGGDAMGPECAELVRGEGGGEEDCHRQAYLDISAPSATIPDVSPDHSATVDSRPSRAEVVAYLRQHRDRITRDYHLRRIAIIGSFARGEERPESDVDILVDLEPGVPDIHRLKGRLRSELERAFGRKVEIASERYLKPYYREEILREAVYV
jgi:predicted nucleotidyltransferase